MGSSLDEYIVGDNHGNQINAQGGTNTIILGSGINIVDGLSGKNTISSSSSSGQTIGTNTLSFEINSDAFSGILAGWYSANTAVDAFLNYSATSAPTHFFTGTNDQAVVEGSGYSALQQVLTGNGYNTVQTGIIATINGSNYSSGVTDTQPAANAVAATTSTFGFDNVYSGAATIRGHQGNNIFIDNITVGSSESLYMGSGSNLIYATTSELATLHIYSATSAVDVLRVEGWGAAVSSGNAFNIAGADPFTGTLINGVTGGVANSGINVLDVRNATDSVSLSPNTVTFGTAANAVGPTFSLSAADILYITGASTTAPTANQTLTLKLDTGEHFTPTGTAVDVHNAALYYSDIYTYTPVNGHTITLNVHYGAG